jgi:hypothetical protein
VVLDEALRQDPDLGWRHVANCGPESCQSLGGVGGADVDPADPLEDDRLPVLPRGIVFGGPRNAEKTLGPCPEKLRQGTGQEVSRFEGG